MVSLWSTRLKKIHYSSQETTASPNNVFVSEESDLSVGTHRIKAG